MMNKLETFAKQQALRKKIKNKPALKLAASPEAVSKLLDCQVDSKKIAGFEYFSDFDTSLEINSEEAIKLVDELEGAFDSEKQKQLIDQTHSEVIHSIVGPFGLGKIMSAYDKTGGNVDTIHNVREGIYATSEARESYNERGAYDPHTVHSHKNYKAKSRADSKQRKESGITDGYSGKQLNADNKADLDHIISGKQTHDDPGRVLAGESTEELANIPENFTTTHSSINRSKKDKSTEDFARSLEGSESARKAEIQSLEKKSNLSEKESNHLNKLKQQDSVDTSELRRKGVQAQKAQDEKINKDYYGSKKFAKDLAHSGVNEGVKMGAQQAFGLLLVEFMSASFSEIKNAFANRHDTGGLIKDLKQRLGRIARRVASKWKDVIDSFFNGFLSGFLSNLVTTIINIFTSTARRTVRLIREGVFSLLRALKIVLFPPEGTTRRESAHEAMKLVAGGGILVAGIALEEVVEGLVRTLPFAEIVTAVIVGALTAMCIAIVTHLIDRMDLLGVIAKQRNEYVINKLDQQNKDLKDSSNKLLEEIESFVLI